MTNVTTIRSEQRGAYLGTAEFYRAPGGEIAVKMTDMVAHMIESRDTIPERFDLFANWLRDGAADLERQGACMGGEQQ